MICTLNHMWLYKEIYTFLGFRFLGLLFASILNLMGRFSTVFCFRRRCLQDYGNGLRKEEFAEVVEGLSSTMKQKEDWTNN
jgi:hypothetical protein